MKMINKTIEDLELDLIEVQAYRDLQDEPFCFDGRELIKNESGYSEDAYYRMQEEDILNCLNKKYKEDQLAKRYVKRKQQINKKWGKI